MMTSAPRPVNEPPTDTANRPPPCVVTHSISLSLIRRTCGNSRRYHSQLITMRNWRANVEAISLEYETQAKRLLGSWPSDHATNATDVQIDFRERGGWVLISRR